MIGAEDRVQLVQSMLSLVPESATSANPQLLGMFGLGGVGKTTLALRIFDEAAKLSRFTTRIFFDVGERCTGEVGLRDKRSKLIQRLSGASSQPSFSTTSGVEERNILRTHLHGSGPLLLVLDNLWTLEQLHWLLACEDSKDLASAMRNLPNNSRVLLTSRNQTIVTVDGHNVIELAGLDDRSAEQLLRREAGMYESASKALLHQDTPEATHSPPDLTPEDIKKALAICSGLPLALQVLGRQLRYTRTRSVQVI